MLRRRVLPALACVVWALVLPAVAFAHASLVRSTPSDRAVLREPPQQVRLFFDDVVRVDSGMKAIRADGVSILAAPPRVVGGRELVVPLSPRLADSDYSVLWRVVADDGHTLAGVVSFAVGAGRGPPIPALSVSNRPRVADVVSRWLYLAGILLAAGTALFRLGVGPVELKIPFVALILVFLGGSEMIAHASIHTRFGLVTTIAILVAAAGAVLAAISATLPRVTPIVWGLSLLLIPAPSLGGHALDRGRPAIEVVVDALHMAAAAFWVGGLVGLVLVLRARDGWERSAGRFSRFVLASVIALAATGLIRAFSELRAVSQVWSTGYGQLLIVKTALFALLVTVGWLNRSRMLPRGDRTGLSRSAVTELALLTAVVVAVALLTDTRPGRDRVALAAPVPTRARPSLPPRDAFVAAAQSGDLAVGLAARGAKLRATVLEPDGLGADGLQVRLGGVPASRCGPGCYAATVPGSRRRDVAVDVDGRRVVLPVRSSAPTAARLVARATRIFARLRSVRYGERLASGPGHRVVATFTLEAPNRLSYLIRGGRAGIVIGTRRWDRGPGMRWIESAQTPLRQPLPIWGRKISNAHVLSQTRRDVTVTFLARDLPAWFAVRFERRTLRPRTLRMVAAAHFMSQRYESFERPRRIVPPPG